MDKITSVKNPFAKFLKQLSEKKARDEAGLMLVEGEVMIKEALACGLSPRAALCVEEYGALAAEMGCEAHIATADVLKSVCDTKSPQGVCAAFETPKPLAVSELPNTVVALDGVQDPGNAGTIWRTADAAGFQAIFFGDGGADPISPKVQRAAMGSGFRLPYGAGELESALIALKTRGYAIIISALDGGDFYARGETGSKFALVIGNEARGVSRECARQATMKLKLPMRGGAESLNAAVAAGIMMYELTKRGY